MIIDVIGVYVAMPQKRRLVWYISVLLILFICLLGIRLMGSSQPSGLGVTNGNLGSCPSSPNCVSTESNDAAHQIEPLEFTGSESDARKKIIQVVQEMPRTTLVTETKSYLHFECRSRLFRFIDDLEFYIDPKNKKIQMRSASRIGYSDLGVNRDRINKIQHAFSIGGE